MPPLLSFIVNVLLKILRSLCFLPVFIVLSASCCIIIFFFPICSFQCQVFMTFLYHLCHSRLFFFLIAKTLASYLCILFVFTFFPSCVLQCFFPSRNLLTTPKACFFLLSPLSFIAFLSPIFFSFCPSVSCLCLLFFLPAFYCVFSSCLLFLSTPKSYLFSCHLSVI